MVVSAGDLSAGVQEAHGGARSPSPVITSQVSREEGQAVPCLRPRGCVAGVDPQHALQCPMQKANEMKMQGPLFKHHYNLQNGSSRAWNQAWRSLAQGLATAQVAAAWLEGRT